MSEKKVTVKIRFDPDSGHPTAEPDECRVRQGDLVLFDGDATFEIVFKGVSPGPPGTPLLLPSKADQGLQRARLAIGNRKGTYRYGIRMDGIEVDPAIIIH